MIESFKESPLLLLFVVSAIGYWIGNIKFGKSQLGVAAVLFAGLAFGSLDEHLQVPEIIIFLGLSMFIYTTGLNNAAGFFQTFRQRGVRDIVFMTCFLVFVSICTIGVKLWLDLNAATTAGLLAGSVTNTPALAGLLDLINTTEAIGIKEQVSNDAVIGYSLSYPMGVVGIMLAIALTQKWLKIDFQQEEENLQKQFPLSMEISRATVAIHNPELVGKPLRELFQRYHSRIVFGRMERNGEQSIPNMDTVLQLHDQIVLVGNEKMLHKAINELGERRDEELMNDSRVYEVRRMFISQQEVVGQSIASLNLSEKYSTIITRITRGDKDVVATGETILEYGDRILIMARREDIPKLSLLFGNSYEALSHINLFSFGLGMAMGLLLGMIKFQFPGGFSFQLGFAGGPLLIALILGSIRRTGPVVWTLPYSANRTLSQIGLILLLAGIGINSGHMFWQTLLDGSGSILLLGAALITIVSSILGLLIGYKFFKIPFSLLSGMIGSQPAVLDFAQQRSNNQIPSIGFTFMLPIGLIVKIILVQLVYTLG